MLNPMGNISSALRRYSDITIIFRTWHFILRFNVSSCDLNDLIAKLNQEIRKQDAHLVHVWYKQITVILSRRHATDGITKNTYSQFLKCVAHIISITVRVINVINLLL